MKRFHLATGLTISFFISLLGSVLRLNRDAISPSLVSVTTSFSYTFASWLLVQYVLQLKKPARYGWKAAIAIAGCMLVSLVPITITRHFAEVQSRIDSIPKGMRAVNILLLFRGLVTGSLLFFISYLLKMAALRQQSQLENERLKQENLQAKLSLLQEQVSPHFLFNSLGTLQTMVSEKAARNFIQKLSEVYRYLLSNRMADLVILKDELDFTLSYLHILNERFEDALITRINVTEAAMYKKLPPASLQLLIENAVKHNLATSETPLHISVSAVDENWLEVTNSLQRKHSVRNSLGSGLSNIKERYHLLTGSTISIEETNDTFTVRIPLLNT